MIMEASAKSNPLPDFELFHQIVAGLEKCVQDLSVEFEPPLPVQQGSGFAFRHQNRNDLLASFLKSVRIASTLNAALVLFEEGYVQEVYALCRMVDEAAEDIFFLAAPTSSATPPNDRERFLNEFFQEEFDDPSDPVASTQKRDRVPRRKVQSAIMNRLPVEGRDPDKDLAVSQTIFKAISGYVHGSYCHIMDLYGGLPQRYHTRGMRGTPRIKECALQLNSYIFRGLLSVEIVADRVGQRAVASQLTSLGVDLARATGCIDGVEIERMELRRTRRGT